MPAQQEQFVVQLAVGGRQFLDPAGAAQDGGVVAFLSRRNWLRAKAPIRSGGTTRSSSEGAFLARPTGKAEGSFFLPIAKVRSEPEAEGPVARAVVRCCESATRPINPRHAQPVPSRNRCHDHTAAMAGPASLLSASTLSFDTVRRNAILNVPMRRIVLSFCQTGARTGGNPPARRPVGRR